MCVCVCDERGTPLSYPSRSRDGRPSSPCVRTVRVWFTLSLFLSLSLSLYLSLSFARPLSLSRTHTHTYTHTHLSDPKDGRPSSPWQKRVTFRLFGLSLRSPLPNDQGRGQRDRTSSVGDAGPELLNGAVKSQQTKPNQTHPISLEKVPVLDLGPQHLCQQRAQRTYQKRASFELFADAGAKERGQNWDLL